MLTSQKSPRSGRALLAGLLLLVLSVACESSPATSPPIPPPGTATTRPPAAATALATGPVVTSPTPPAASGTASAPTATASAPAATVIPPTMTELPASPTAGSAGSTPGAPPQIAVLAYHHFGVPAAGDYDCPLDKFEAQLRWLKKAGYQSVLPQQFVAAIHERATLPAHPVMFTFDDNNAEQYLDAAPLLDKYGYHGAFFLMTVTIGKRYYMKADQLKDLVRRGHVVGGHTWDHRNLALLTLPEVQRQLDLSESDLTELLGHKPAFMSYPFGGYNAADVQELKARGYQGAFRLRDPDDPKVDPAFMIHRQIIPGVWSLDDFIQSVHSMEP